jgi:hypothetical protein
LIGGIAAMLAYYGYTTKQYADARKKWEAREAKKKKDKAKKHTEREAMRGALELMGAQNVDKMLDEPKIRSFDNRVRAKQGTILGNTKGR